MLTHLALSGQLKGLAGLVAGEFKECGDKSAIYSLLSDILSDLNIPSATGLAAGHGSENLAFPIGLTAELDTDLMALSFIERAVV
jgi:muramoyltetrapeptide carboxypeptidase